MSDMGNITQLVNSRDSNRTHPPDSQAVWFQLYYSTLVLDFPSVDDDVEKVSIIPLTLYMSRSLWGLPSTDHSIPCLLSVEKL